MRWRDSRAGLRSSLPPAAQPAACQASTSSGLSKVKPTVEPLPWVAGAPLIRVRHHQHRAAPAITQPALVIGFRRLAEQRVVEFRDCSRSFDPTIT
jgi:hypothetical protein